MVRFRSLAPSVRLARQVQSTRVSGVQPGPEPVLLLSLNSAQ